ncbi:ferredoxin [Nocardia nepalensis]|uniref:ferredoxin n=1 Tax=Nocardia nepalensis TaxID=3375448 RepID=UPI003B67AE73
MKLSIDYALCDGQGQCIAVSDGLFDFDGNGKTVITATTHEDPLSLARLAAAACPNMAISVSED